MIIICEWIRVAVSFLCVVGVLPTHYYYVSLEDRFGKNSREDFVGNN